jgi:hypothetical protein
MQQLCPWVSLSLEQHVQLQSEGVQLSLAYNYASNAEVHVLTLYTQGLPLLLFCDSTQAPTASPWDLCERGDLGSMEANVMAGRALHAGSIWSGRQRAALCYFPPDGQAHARELKVDSNRLSLQPDLHVSACRWMEFPSNIAGYGKKYGKFIFGKYIFILNIGSETPYLQLFTWTGIV